MSDSDDTDVLLLIPSDLFLIPSSDSEEDFNNPIGQKNQTGVVSDLIDHVQTLESRILAIEAKDSPSNFSNASYLKILDGITSETEKMRKTKYAASRNSSSRNTSSKQTHCYSQPSTRSIRQKLNYSNERKHHYLNTDEDDQMYNTEPSFVKRHSHSKSFSENLHSQHESQNESAFRAAIGSSERDSLKPLSPASNICENNSDLYAYKSLSTECNSSNYKLIEDLNLPEGSQLLKEIQSNGNGRVYGNGNCHENTSKSDSGLLGKNNICKKKMGDEPTSNGMNRERRIAAGNIVRQFMYPCNRIKRQDLVDDSLPNNSLFSFDTEKFQTEFKTWDSNCCKNIDCSRMNQSVLNNLEDCEKSINGDETESNEKSIEGSGKNDFSVMGNFRQQVRSRENYNQQAEDNFISVDPGKLPKTLVRSISTPNNFTLTGSLFETKNVGKNTEGDGNQTITRGIMNETESTDERLQCLFSLSDICNEDAGRSVEGILRLELGEEKCRREHCEQLIQGLQKKLLEKEEELAVALRVNSEMNFFVSQFQVSWTKMKHKLHQSEIERDKLQEERKDSIDKHRLELLEYQKKIENFEEELSKTFNLATSYKEKYDEVVKEKIAIRKTHSDELQNYKKRVEKAQGRYEQIKTEYQNSLENSAEADEALKCARRDLDAELLKSSEIRVELSVIHKALDACEAELAILRQEKENLQLKLKEESDRNNLLDQGKQLLAEAVDEAKKAEILAKDQISYLTEQQEKLRSELRDVYQKQVDEVVKTKLHEFQTQLDAAESVFQNEVEVKQRAIAECAARKIKGIMDKHRLEIDLVEEKHKEEKNLFEIKLAQVVQKSTILETQLNSYRKIKSHLVEQLYSMLQKQWQEALMIISEGNGSAISSLKKVGEEKFVDISSKENLELNPEYFSIFPTVFTEIGAQKIVDMKAVQAQDAPEENSSTLASNGTTPLSNDKESESDLIKYINMILAMQQKNDDHKSESTKDNPLSSEKEICYKQSSEKYDSITNERNSKWQPILEVSIHETSEYLSPSQESTSSSHKMNKKLPWK